MYVYNVVFYETMINDERFSLFCGNLASFLSKKEREKKKFCVLWAKERYFFFKSEKRLLTDGQKGDKKKSRKREKHRNR